MAERRMFAKAIVNSDAFLEMPLSAQALYFHLGMNADDDGFVNRPQAIMRQVRASEDDLKVLVAKSFLIAFESRVLVVKHWRVNNYIQKDRYKPTEYTEERAQLTLKDNSVYSLKTSMDTQCIQNGYRLDTQDSLGKDSLGKVVVDASASESAGATTTTTRPMIEEVRQFAEQEGIVTDVDAFYYYNEDRGWDTKSWRSALIRWAALDKDKQQVTGKLKLPASDDVPRLSSEDFERSEKRFKLAADQTFLKLDQRYRVANMALAKAELAGKEDTSEEAGLVAQAKAARDDRIRELGFEPEEVGL